MPEYRNTFHANTDVEVVVRRGDDEPVGTAEVEHQHGQSAGEQREAQAGRTAARDGL